MEHEVLEANVFK